MSLTRKMLKAMGIEDDKIEQIIDAHTETVDALKKERDSFKEDAEKLPDVQKELADLKKDAKENDWKGKFDKEHADFEKYKADIATKERSGKIKAEYRKLLGECKVGEKHMDAIMRVTDFSKMEIGEDGKLTNAEDLKKSIGTEWSGFITTEGVKKPEVNNPPANGDPNGQNTNRASILAAQYNENLYGKAKEG